MRTPLPSRLLLAALFVLPLSASQVFGQLPIVPGTGVKLDQVGDDFEDPDWEFFPRAPKSSEEMDGNKRLPAGVSKNKRWYEGIKRGYPDVVKRVPTPPGGLEGSEGALLMQSMFTGIPGKTTNRMQQDDFVADVQSRLGRSIAVSQSPSVVVRVFLPPVDTWEKRSGVHFGFRTSLETTKNGQPETYWPGLFIVFESKHDGKNRNDNFAYLRIRGNTRGHDYQSIPITQTGWWTMGMSVTSDGKVHYYAKPGIDDLTADDYLGSEFPYGYRAQQFKTFFFNVCSLDNGRTWSTPWIVDDPAVYVIPTGTASTRSPNRR